MERRNMKPGALTVMAKERRAAGFTLGELSAAAHVNPSTLGMFERGAAVPNEAQAEKIAAALGWRGDPRALFVEL